MKNCDLIDNVMLLTIRLDTNGTNTTLAKASENCPLGQDPKSKPTPKMYHLVHLISK